MKKYNRLLQGGKAVSSFIALIFMAGCVEQTPAKPYDSIAPVSGWIETVAIVSDTDRAVHFFTDVAGYEVMYEGALAPQIVRSWGLNPDVTGTEVLVREPDASRGFIRLVKLDNAGPQIEARSAGSFLDSGGIMGLNVRVFDIDKTFYNLQRAGWRPLSDPVSFSVENFSVSEAVFMGPDGLVIGLLERMKPPLDNTWSMEPGRLSRPNNAFVITRDIKAGGDFFKTQMKWNVFLTDKGKAAKPGMNLYGWPHDLVGRVDRDVAWFHPDETAATREGTIALISLTGAKGRDFTQTAKPPNFGWTTLRTWTPVDADATSDAGGFYLAPYGCVTLRNTRSPDGVLIENIMPSENCG